MITYRSQKGAPLTAEEVDGNFRELETRVKVLEDHKEITEGIGKITVQGDQMTIAGTFGADFGTFSLPKAGFKPHGAWISQIAYHKLDLVTYEGGLFLCLNDHSSKTWDQEGAFWQEIIPKLSSVLSLYEKATLPAKEVMGKFAFLMDEKGPTLVFFDGKKWQSLKGGIL
jgi:hypothetical protein